MAGIHGTAEVEVMTIPDLGHCVGSGTEPAHDTVREDRRGTATGVCPACSGRFELHHTGVLSLHDAAEVEEREPWSDRQADT
jgi:hypothetical protein